MSKRYEILAAIEQIEGAELNYKAVQADPSTSFDQRTGGRRAAANAKLSFQDHWQGVRDILSLMDRLEKWFYANSEMRSMEVLEGESLRWHVRLKEIMFECSEGEDNERVVAKHEAGTFEEALDGALRMVEGEDATRAAGE